MKILNSKISLIFVLLLTMMVNQLKSQTDFIWGRQFGSDKDGSMLWERNFAARGINGDTSGKSVSFDKKGCFYHVGLTGANLFGTLIGGHDFYVVKFASDNRF